MRIWSLHPKYLDSRGLVALWREGLLAQAVLRGKTVGYRHHPQLARFRQCPWPLGAIADYLRAVHEESVERGYNFGKEKISRARLSGTLIVTSGQIQREWKHLLGKLKVRDPERAIRFDSVKRPRPHPLFRVVGGGAEEWDRSA